MAAEHQEKPQIRDRPVLNSGVIDSGVPENPCTGDAGGEIDRGHQKSGQLRRVHLVRREPRKDGDAVVHEAEGEAQVSPVRAGDRILRRCGYLPTYVVEQDGTEGRKILLRAARGFGAGGRARGRRRAAADVVLGARERGLARRELSLAGVERGARGVERGLLFSSFTVLNSSISGLFSRRERGEGKKKTTRKNKKKNYSRRRRRR